MWRLLPARTRTCIVFGAMICANVVRDDAGQNHAGICSFPDPLGHSRLVDSWILSIRRSDTLLGASISNTLGLSTQQQPGAISRGRGMFLLFPASNSTSTE